MNSPRENSDISSPAKEIVYSADRRQDVGLSEWKRIYLDFRSSRELVFSLMGREITAAYRQSMLGYVWAVAPTIVTAMVFSFLTSHRVLPIGTVPLPYVVFALWSVSVWQLFSGILVSATNSLTNAGSLVTKINFPKESLVYASIAQPVFDFIVRLLPVLAAFMFYKIVPSWQVVFVPLVLVPLVVMALGIGFFLSVFNLLARDIGSFVTMVLAFAMFVTPVLYPPPVTAPYFLVNILNPVSPLIIATQDLIAFGELRHIDLLVIALLFSSLVFLTGLRIFKFILPRVIERA